MNFKNALVKTLVLAVLLLQGCSKKDSGPDAPDKEKPEEEKSVLHGKLKSVSWGTEYFYNSDGSLVKTETKLAGDLIAFQDFVYKDGLIASSNASEKFPKSPETPLAPFFKQDFKYSGTQVVEIQEEYFVPEPKLNERRHMFVYDSKGFIKTKKTEIFGTDGSVFQLIVARMTTDERGNVIKCEKDYYESGVFMSTSVEVNEYDNKTNPYFKLAKPVNVEEYFCPNNRTKTIITSDPGYPGTAFFDYEYNAAGQPVKITTRHDSSSHTVLLDYYD